MSVIQDDITSSNYRLLKRVNIWAAFSNHTLDGGGSASNSLEGIHDKIHGYVGGHMGDPGANICSVFGKLSIPKCGSAFVLLKVEPSQFLVTQPLTVTRYLASP